MRRLLMLAILFAVPTAWAAPFLEADLPDQATTHCALSLDGAAFGPDAPVSGTPKTCKVDLASVAPGAHSARLVAVKADAVWGRQESAPSAPFPFTRPGAPATPSGSRLVP
jgi:hypothetical protein